MNAAAHSSRSLVLIEAKASFRSSGLWPMHGYWPFSAREIASVLISSMVRSLLGCGGCCAKAATAKKLERDNKVASRNLLLKKRYAFCIWPTPPREFMLLAAESGGQ